ncbi:Hypothetical protein IALB_2333 [Ignavibacterium album JCM 16511]|uniref:Outer membrane protein beta-barrel domain-containing protein n=1 Tax=Ignavibacterium album (strain DSM 19864 / JCM 16511 / NBRC 101810 / Mat9-16) TaxID=945713 RepID=I0AM29_IGNAJ|nr:hypothetical protein [Ignavibacterium album]AFH50036.1 Hypothetical protein IALB_2333 [Ignavibacterium album JCM 16511]
MKQILLVLIVALLNTQFLLGQINLIGSTDYSNFENNAEIDNNLRGIFLFSSIGILDFLSLGIGYQVSEKISIAIKGSQTFIGSSAMGFPHGGNGVGIKISYHTPFLFFNTTSLEYISYLSTSFDDHINSITKGNYFDFNLGREIIDESGFNFFWAIGFCVSAAKEANVLYTPSLKIGLNFNFIEKE